MTPCPSRDQTQTGARPRSGSGPLSGLGSAECPPGRLLCLRAEAQRGQGQRSLTSAQALLLPVPVPAPSCETEWSSAGAPRAALPPPQPQPRGRAGAQCWCLVLSVLAWDSPMSPALYGGSLGFPRLWGPKLAAAPQPHTPAGSGAAPAMGRGCSSARGRSRRGWGSEGAVAPQLRVALMKPARSQARCTLGHSVRTDAAGLQYLPPAGTSSRTDLREALQPMPPALSQPLPPLLDSLPISRQLLLPSPPSHPFWHLLPALAPFLWFPMPPSPLAGRTGGDLGAWVLSTRRMRSVGAGAGAGRARGVSGAADNSGRRAGTAGPDGAGEWDEPRTPIPGSRAPRQRNGVQQSPAAPPHPLHRLGAGRVPAPRHGPVVFPGLGGNHPGSRHQPHGPHPARGGR